MSIIGIDQSKRSTAIVALDDNGELMDFALVTPPLEYDKEILINYQWEIISCFMTAHKPTAIALEGAAFAAGGASSDLLWGIQWYIRTRTFVEFPDVPIGIITPASWRASIVHAKEQKEFKQRYGGKIGLKHAVISKLPQNVRSAMNNYLDMHKHRLQAAKGYVAGGTSKEYLTGLHDLADAWGVARHRWLLSQTGGKAKAKPEVKKMSVLKRRFPNAG